MPANAEGRSRAGPASSQSAEPASPATAGHSRRRPWPAPGHPPRCRLGRPPEVGAEVLRVRLVRGGREQVGTKAGAPTVPPTVGSLPAGRGRAARGMDPIGKRQRQGERLGLLAFRRAQGLHATLTSQPGYNRRAAECAALSAVRSCRRAAPRRLAGARMAEQRMLKLQAVPTGSRQAPEVESMAGSHDLARLQMRTWASAGSHMPTVPTRRYQTTAPVQIVVLNREVAQAKGGQLEPPRTRGPTRSGRGQPRPCLRAGRIRPGRWAPGSSHGPRCRATGSRKTGRLRAASGAPRNSPGLPQLQAGSRGVGGSMCGRSGASSRTGESPGPTTAPDAGQRAALQPPEVLRPGQLRQP